MTEKMDFADGKYTVINDNGKLTALRHGEPWGRDYIRAVYALGNLPDARKPKPMSNAERCRRHKARRALPRVPNSVFNLAAFL